MITVCTIFFLTNKRAPPNPAIIEQNPLSAFDSCFKVTNDPIFNQSNVTVLAPKPVTRYVSQSIPTWMSKQQALVELLYDGTVQVNRVPARCMWIVDLLMSQSDYQIRHEKYSVSDYLYEARSYKIRVIGRLAYVLLFAASFAVLLWTSPIVLIGLPLRWILSANKRDSPP